MDTFIVTVISYIITDYHNLADEGVRCSYKGRNYNNITKITHCLSREAGAQWLSGRVLDSRPKGCGFEPHRSYCVVSLRKNINPSLVLVQPRKTRPFITERLLMGRKESNQSINKPGSILQNTRACTDNGNNTITEHTGKVKIREV